LISEPNPRRVPRVGRVWLAQAHTQAFQTPPSAGCVLNGQVGPRPSPKPIALACLERAVCIQTCVMCAFARLLSKNITRASGVQKHHPCFIHAPGNQTSRIEHGTHASKPPPKSPRKYDYVEQRVICSLV
jgi:hypothetical protein